MGVCIAMPRTGPRPNYGTKRRRRPEGYIDVFDPKHPLARRDGYLMEHRRIAWDAGLLTDPTDQVHHINHIRDDNRIENFEIKSAADHTREHQEARGYVVNQYGKFPVKDRSKRQSAPRPERDCVGCGIPVPLTLRRDAVYCSGNCRVRTFKRNQTKARRAVRARAVHISRTATGRSRSAIR